jgi:hypothetical protein
VASLIPSLKTRLQLEQAKPRDRSGDEETRHRKWIHVDLLRWSLMGRRVAPSPLSLPI